ncbi:MAG: hypothetical protein K0R29_2774 [Pseudobdellovibrio sp.]|jgi:hypothetical protein|nr:hypothetical protein [Pseudobdellovibrio sp.]
MKKSVLALTLLISTKSFAFSVPDHRMISELAFAELQQCGLFPKNMEWQNDAGQASIGVMINSNLEEDNYLKNGIKKLFQYSHFYNPVRPIKKEWNGREHAGKAVEDYTKSFIKAANTRTTPNLPRKPLEEVGQMIHLVQDASSPPHVLWINHATEDGFENKVKILRQELEAMKPSCETITLAGLNTPMEILKAAGLGTMKELDNSVEFNELQADGSEPKFMSAMWSRTFFSNSGAYTRKVMNFLTQFDILRPNLNTPTSDDNDVEGWSSKGLDKGDYGVLSSGISNVTLRGDNFGKSNRLNINGKTYIVAGEQFKKLRKVLLRQSILNTQRIILWAAQK